MGVHGLWRLIEPSGKPVPVESLENKVLAVDVSIWLHQAIKGFQDAKGAPAVNAHLLGVFHRVCKLLYFKVKPIFVFDGGVPTLKRETISKRNKLKEKHVSDADRLQKQLLNTLIKHSAIQKVLSDKAKATITSISSANPTETKQAEDLYKLPELDSTKSSSDEEDTSETDSGSPTKHWNLHNIDTKSDQFKSLPADVRHEILTDLKETRKQSSWGRLHELPTQSDDFSGFQMKRLLKRYEVQAALDEAAQEIGGHSHSLEELEEILREQGVISEKFAKSRIASDENTRYLYIRNVKEALEAARLREELKLATLNEEENENKEKLEENQGNEENSLQSSNKADIELEKDLNKAIALSLQDQPSSSGYMQKKKLSDFSFLENFCDEDFDSEDSEKNDYTSSKVTKLTSAQNYMMEYSGLAPKEIERIIESNEGKKPEKRKLHKVKDNVQDSKSSTDDVQNKISTLEILGHSEGKGKGISESIEPELKKAKLSDEVKISKPVEIASSGEESDEEFEEVEDSQIIERNEENKIKTNNEIESLEKHKLSMTGSNTEKFEGKLNSSHITEQKKEIIAREESISKTVDVLSDSGDSDDFEDVPLKTAKEENVFEIKIETEKFEENDDLFADIFTPKAEAEVSTSMQKGNDQLSKKEKVIETSAPVEEINLLQESRKAADEMKIKNELKLKLSEDLTKIEDQQTQKESQKLEKFEIDNKNKVADPEDSLLQDLRKKATKLGGNSEPQLKLSEEELVKMKEQLNQEQLDLRNEQGQKERLGTNITDQMYKEAQDLLELFGLPYVIAPMEAEAQCAFLESISLTDGTITDDSDIWLFGGKTVYKNFFNQSKHVLEYRAEDIKHHFKLTREQMILLALLVGSDYTVGLQGVGPVTALEILAAFPSSNASSFTLSHHQLLMGLGEFKSWFMNGKTTARAKHSLRNKLKNITFTENFPSAQVVQAYLNPTVDTNEEKFTWSKPDFVALIDFGRTKFGWSKTKTEEILKPVIRKLKETKYQSTLLKYFQIKHNLNAEEAQKLMSERVKSAVKRIGQDPQEAEDSEDIETETKKTKKIKTSNSEKKSLKTKGPQKGKGKKKSSSNDQVSILSDDEFVEMDKLEAILESVEKEENMGKSSEENGPAQKTSKKEVQKTLNKKVKQISIKKKEKDVAANENQDVKNKNVHIEIKDNQEPSTSNHDQRIENTDDNHPKYVVKSGRVRNASKQMGKKNLKTNIRKGRAKKEEASSTPILEFNEDEELKLLQETEMFSEKRVEEITTEVEKKIEQEMNKTKLLTRKLHRKEVIPQREREQRNLVKTRLKAIEVFRKTKIDPKKKKGGAHKATMIKDDAGLSESSSDSDL